MDLYLTYCSADKDHNADDLPALQRYRSERVLAVHDAAVLSGAEFRILSGEFGLLAADDPIPDYDHLLTDGEVEAHAAKVAAQLFELDPDVVYFFARGLDEDPAAGPYRACLEHACLSAGVRRFLIEIPTGDSSATRIVNLARLCGPDRSIT